MSAALLAVACGGGNQPTTAPSTTSTNPSPLPTTATQTSAPATDQPTDQPTAELTAAPSGGLDPSLSDEGVVGRITITGDARRDESRDGTYEIIGGTADGFDSSCGYSLDDEFTAVAWDDDAPEGQIRQMAVTVAAANIPEGDETISGIEDGRVYTEFMSENFFGTAYSADAADDDRTSVTVDVTRIGDGLVFDYTGLTWDQVEFTGQMACAEIV